MALRDNSPAVKAAMRDKIKNFLTEAGGEIRSKTAQNSRVDVGQTKNSYQYRIEEDSTEQKVYIGSDLMNAVYEEFGTGEFALKNGKKGGWWIPVGNGEGQISLKTVKKYRWVKYRYQNGAVSKYLRQTQKRGPLVAVFTYGKKPNKPMQRAYDELKEPIKRRLQDILSDLE